MYLFTGDISMWQDFTDNKDSRHPTVYFKVTAITPKSHGHKGTYLVDTHKSTLFLVQFICIKEG